MEQRNVGSHVYWIEEQYYYTDGGGGVSGHEVKNGRVISSDEKMTAVLCDYKSFFGSGQIIKLISTDRLRDKP